MKKTHKYFILIISFFILACSTSQKVTSSSNIKEPTGLDIPPALIRDLTLVNMCTGHFSSSSYGKMAFLKYEEFKKQSHSFDLDRKPVCSIDQAMFSNRLISYFSKQFSETFDAKGTTHAEKIRISLQALKFHTQVFLEMPLTLGEVLLELNFLSKVIEKSSILKDSRLNNVISLFISHLKIKQDEIIKRAIAYDNLITQNTAYRTEIYDWSLMSIIGSVSTLPIPTAEQLQMFSKQNKYAEVLNLEKFKLEVLQNLECIKNKECFVCEFTVERKQCPNDKDEKNILSENLVFLKFFGAKVGDGILKYYLKTNMLFQD
jgi:hypothetical protein